VPAGLWHIKIKASDDLVRAVDVDVHVQRDVAGLFARQKGRQSYFDDSEQQLRRAFTSPTAGTEQTLVSTLTAYGGAEGVLVVAGYRHSDGKPAAYSSSGRAKGLRSEPNVAAVSQKSPAGSLKGHGAEPDIAAVSEESPAFRGILATGTASGSVAIVNGTSVAAALVTRALADTIASGGLVDDLINQAKKFETEHPTQPDEDYDRARRFGAGRLPFKSSYPARTDGGLATVEGAPLEVSKAQAATLATRE
jgi:hypothetical protein